MATVVVGAVTILAATPSSGSPGSVAQSGGLTGNQSATTIINNNGPVIQKIETPKGRRRKHKKPIAVAVAPKAAQPAPITPQPPLQFPTPIELFRDIPGRYGANLATMHTSGPSGTFDIPMNIESDPETRVTIVEFFIDSGPDDYNRIIAISESLPTYVRLISMMGSSSVGLGEIPGETLPRHQVSNAINIYFDGKMNLDEQYKAMHAFDKLGVVARLRVYYYLQVRFMQEHPVTAKKIMESQAAAQPH